MQKMMSIVDYIKFSGRMPSAYEDLLNHFYDSAAELDAIIRDIVKKNKIEDK
jgi:hypothetical protein